jgi:cephalosporin-C deacetylase-like acetyl esterase
VQWTISKDGVPPITEGIVRLTNGSATVIGRLDEPGFLQCRAVFRGTNQPTRTAVAGAAIDPLLIKPSLPVPADFDAFWAVQKKKLAAVPVNARLTPVESAPTNVECFDVQADSLGAPVSGYYARPAGAQARSLPIILTVHGAGVRSASLSGAVGWAGKGMLALDLNAHGLPNGQAESYYTNLANADLKDYRTRGRESRETIYFLGMFLRLVRAIDFLTAQPEWNGRTLIVHGSSQGGAQSIVAAGLDPRVSFFAAGVPAMCDHTGVVVGRANGWPKFLANPPAVPASNVVEAVRYYDAMNFATRVRCAGVVTVGFIDATCPPTSVYAAYNALAGPKQIFNDPPSTHTVSARASEAMRTAMMAHIEGHLRARTFHVDAVNGDDTRDGLKPETAWRSLAAVDRASLARGDRVLLRRGQTWRGQLIPRSGDASGVVTYGAYGEGPKPVLLGSVAADRPTDWERIGEHLWATPPLGAPSSQANPLSVDVGNIIFDHGKSTGVKRWSEADLHREGDYYDDARTKQVKLRSDDNPATHYRSIELALRRHIIDQSGRAYVTYENLDLRYGAAHGIGGGNTRHITIRGCDLSFIGGGHQFTAESGRPVRYGNGIEFWSDARDCLVEDCRLWEIYDAALTNQGDGTNVQENIVYRRNVIWNSEYSFEYWNRGSGSVTRNIVFEHNTCVDAGYGWGHRQRPDPNGRHLMFYDNAAATTNLVIRHNIFCNATDSILRLSGRDWTAALAMDHNCWYQPCGPVLLWGRQTVSAEEFAAFMHARGFDHHSLLADPKFLNAAQHDYRLAPDSPARALTGQGEPAGALSD